jgi:hypothetical protein
MAKPKDDLRGDAQLNTDIYRTAPVDDHSDMAGVDSAAFANGLNGLATITDTISCTNRRSK